MELVGVTVCVELACVEIAFVEIVWVCAISARGSKV